MIYPWSTDKEGNVWLFTKVPYKICRLIVNILLAGPALGLFITLLLYAMGNNLALKHGTMVIFALALIAAAAKTIFFACENGTEFFTGRPEYFKRRKY